MQKKHYSQIQNTLPSNSRSRRVPPSPLSAQSTTHLLQYENHHIPRKNAPLPPNPFGDPGPTRPNIQSRNNGPGLGAVSRKFNLDPDSLAWCATNEPEDDDWLHGGKDAHLRRNVKKLNSRGSVFTFRGLLNVGCLLILALGLTALFAGYPIIDHFTRLKLTNLGGYNLGGINATGQIMETVFALIDPDTPKDLYNKIGEHGEEFELVFSDEFNVEGRTFYPGDDPFWEAVDLNYWATFNLEWYDPQQVTTKDGYLQITLEPMQIHNLDYAGGMISTWNKFCFTGGRIETSVSLPGSNDVTGLWPAVWTMGNLGRAGYGATAEGLWPYSYEACDVGTLANQTLNGLPRVAATSGHNPETNFALSYLPGQRLSSCTCPGEAHPGPVKKDGTFVGRSAPEIDVLEAQVSNLVFIGEVSQSVQWAPFDAAYSWNNETYMSIDDPNHSALNLYKGGVYQQASSVVSRTNQGCYQFEQDCFAVYGFEYKPGYQDEGGYVTWINDNKRAWTLQAGGLEANPLVEISARPIPLEPMYIIINLGMSNGFSPVDLEHLRFPAIMKVDYIRVYQPKGTVNYGCDPEGFITSNYINQYIEAYTNPNLTTWVDDYKQTWPKNRLVDEC